MSSIVTLIVVVFCGILFLFFLSMFPVTIWIRGLSAGLPTGPINLIAMQLRNVPSDLIVDTYIKGKKAGLDIYIDRLEAHYLSGGDVVKVIDALISAVRAHLDLTFEKAAAIDLAGRDVLDAVRMRIEPRVISTGEVSGMAQNGFEVIALAKITVRANLATVVGGAGEETILARVGEGIVSAIGAAKTHTDILTCPELITKKIMNSGLDANTAYEILSVDIFDVNVARNIGAILQKDQAEADNKVAQAKAEGRRAMARAQLQENKAMEQEMKAKLVESEAVVPQALAKSISKGQILPTRKGRKKAIPAAVGFGADHA